MDKKDRMSKCDYQDRLNNLLKGSFNTRLQPLRSLNTATKKRRAAKRQSERPSDFTKPSTTSPG